MPDGRFRTVEGTSVHMATTRDEPEVTASYIMPARNPNPEWLRAAVDSVLAEREVTVELIVVDDGSHPPVSDLLVGLEDSRLGLLPASEWLDVPHRGASAARNAGLALARGRFVRYIDSDDAITPGSTAHLVRLRGQDNQDRLVTFGGMTYCDSELRLQWSLGCRLDGDMFEPVMRGRVAAYMPCLLIPRPLLDIVGPWDETLDLCEDLDFMFRLSEFARLRGDETPVYLYRRHEASASAKGPRAGEDPWRSVYERHYERHPEHRGTRVERWLEAAYMMGQVVQRWDARAPLGFLRSLACAVRLAPADAWHHARSEIKYRRLQRRGCQRRSDATENPSSRPPSTQVSADGV